MKVIINGIPYDVEICPDKVYTANGFDYGINIIADDVPDRILEVIENRYEEGLINAGYVTEKGIDLEFTGCSGKVKEWKYKFTGM